MNNNVFKLIVLVLFICYNTYLCNKTYGVNNSYCLQNQSFEECSLIDTCVFVKIVTSTDVFTSCTNIFKPDYYILFCNNLKEEVKNKNYEIFCYYKKVLYN